MKADVFKMRWLYIFVSLSVVAACSGSRKLSHDSFVTEKYRPQIHFSPVSGWMNDPNGLVLSNGTYHLFYQYYPDSIVWGPMHWGHATSPDLVHWRQQPIALYPDSLGYIFSGSIVLDKDNTSGFGTSTTPPLVAVFTSHDPKGEKEGSLTFQNQSIAYSLDDGKTWTKYLGNPVLKNPGIRDFRDPKVSWNNETKKWIMTLATQDRITFFSSPDLKSWTKESEFGQGVGSHGGVWECPDLFTLHDGGKEVWILLVSIGNGGPNGGSATQYFVGTFDGHIFSPVDEKIRWIDYGPDDYAGVTFSNTGAKKIFLGWMSNWAYANVVPATTWRSSMTVPRQLELFSREGRYFVKANPVTEIRSLVKRQDSIINMRSARVNISGRFGEIKAPLALTVRLDLPESFAITISNTDLDTLRAGYDAQKNIFFIDRTKAGISSFHEKFATISTAPRLATSSNLSCTIYLDKTSLELYGDDGASVLTSIIFPHEDYRDALLTAPEPIQLSMLKFQELSPMR